MDAIQKFIAETREKKCWTLRDQCSVDLTHPIELAKALDMLEVMREALETIAENKAVEIVATFSDEPIDPFDIGQNGIPDVFEELRNIPQTLCKKALQKCEQIAEGK